MVFCPIAIALTSATPPDRPASAFAPSAILLSEIAPAFVPIAIVSFALAVEPAIKAKA